MQQESAQPVTKQLIENNLSNFASNFEKTYGGKLLINSLRCKQRGTHWNLRIEGKYFPPSRRAFYIIWVAAAHQAMVTSPQQPPYPYELSFYFFLPNKAYPSETLEIEIVKVEVPYNEIHNQPNPLTYLLEKLTTLPFIQDERNFSILRICLTQPLRNDMLHFFYHDLVKMAKGAYRDWHWRLAPISVRLRRYGKMWLTMQYLFHFYKTNGLSATFPIKISYYPKLTFPEEVKIEDKETFAIELPHPQSRESDDYYHTVRIREPFKNFTSLRFESLYAISAGDAYLKQRQLAIAYNTEELLTAIENMARYVIDTVLLHRGIPRRKSTQAPSVSAEDRKRVRKALSILFSVGFALSTYLTKRVRGESFIENRSRDSVDFGVTPYLYVNVKYDVRVARKGTLFPDTLVNIMGKVVYQEPTTNVTLDVKSGTDASLRINPTYSIQKDILKLNREDEKAIALALVRECVAFLRQIRW